MSGRARGLTRDEIRALPAVIDLETAGRALGVGKSTSYTLAKAGDFPVPVMRIAKAYRVSTALLMELLGIKAEDARESAHHVQAELPAPEAVAPPVVSASGVGPQATNVHAITGRTRRGPSVMMERPVGDSKATEPMTGAEAWSRTLCVGGYTADDLARIQGYIAEDA